VDSSIFIKKFISIKSVLIGSIVTVAVIALWSFLGASTKFELVSVTPTSSSAVDAQEVVVVFEFNQELDLGPGEELRVFVSPNVGVKQTVNGSTLHLNMFDLLPKNNVKYLITVESIPSVGGQSISTAVTDFTVSLSDQTVKTIASLPYVGSGYRIDLFSDDTILVSVTDKPYSKFSRAADDYLNSNGLYLDVFKIVTEPDYDSLKISPNDQIFPEGE